MLNMANNSRLLMKPEAAEKMAAELNEYEEDGWTYKVKHPPTSTGWSLIEIYDEDGEYVDVWKMS